MQELVREHAGDLPKKLTQKGVELFLCWIHWTQVVSLVTILIIAPTKEAYEAYFTPILLCEELRLAESEGLRVSRGVELTDHPDASPPGVLHHLRHVLRPVHGQARVPGTLLAANNY